MSPPPPPSPAQPAGSPTLGNDRERVLTSTDIVALVEEHVALRSAGKEYVGLCPFHDDRKPSMYVSPQKQIFKCFACGAGGNAFDFVMRLHSLDFVEALKFLAERAGVELTPWKPPSRGRGDAGGAGGSGDAGDGRVGGVRAGGVSREQMLRAAAFAAEFFRSIYQHPEHGSAARAVAERRGMTPEVIQAFGIGAAPDRFDGLLKMAAARGVPVAALDAAGLIKRRESGGHYDALRHRLIFPIQDQMGRPIAFGGRRLREEDEPKYLNSPETALFDKSATLYGLPQAMKAIKAQGHAIVTEGYTDVIACHQAGIANVVATLGTACTARHAALLRRVCSRVTLLFDGDEAGQKAADRAVEVFFREPIDVNIVVLPDGADPDDVLKREGGVDEFEALIEQGREALEFRFARLDAQLRAAGHGRGSRARSAAVEQEVDRLVDLGLAEMKPIARQTVARRLASVAGVDVGAVLESIGRAQRRPARPGGRRPAGGGGGGESERGDNVPALSPADVDRALQQPTDMALACLLAEPGLRRVRALAGDGVEPTAASAVFSAECVALASNSGYFHPSARALAERVLGLLAPEAERSGAGQSEAGQSEAGRRRGGPVEPGGDRSASAEAELAGRAMNRRAYDFSSTGALVDAAVDPAEAGASRLRELAFAYAAAVGRLVGADAERVAQEWAACITALRREASLRGAESESDRLAALREAHKAFGGDPLAIPRTPG